MELIMAIKINTNETFDQQGNLLYSETVEFDEVDNPMIDVVKDLTPLQRQTLLDALKKVQ
jgi:hypothetical protein